MHPQHNIIKKACASIYLSSFSTKIQALFMGTHVFNNGKFITLHKDTILFDADNVFLQIGLKRKKTHLMLKNIFTTALFLGISLSCTFAQNIKLSDNERTLIVDEINENIKTLARFKYDNPELLAVYHSQIKDIEKVVEKYRKQSSDPVVYERWHELNLLSTQNREMINFLYPKMTDILYRQGISSLENGDVDRARRLFNKALQYNSNYVMSHYQLAKIEIDSMHIASGAEKLENILNSMSPTADQKKLITDLLNNTYNKNFMYALSLADQGKHARAMEVLSQLKQFCDSDKLGICKDQTLANAITKSKSQIYKDHIKIANKSLHNGKNAVAESFALIAYEYYSENKESLPPDTEFETLIKKIAQNYLSEAKKLEGDRKAALYQEYLDKADALAQYLNGEDRKALKTQVAALEPTKSKLQQKQYAIEENAKDTAYSDKFADFRSEDDDDLTDEEVQNNVAQIEKNYVNENTKKTKSNNTEISKSLNDKFYETRSLLSVNSFEKALEVLEKANQLARIGNEKNEVEDMYRRAIREITAKRMSAAEYAVWQGDINTADSLVNLTNDLIRSYNMGKDTAVVRIMNSYLNALDKKVCSKRQDEINSYVYNILDCIKRNDYYKAEAYVREALAVPETRKCKLDKSKLKALMKQIEKPLEYIDRLDNAYTLLRSGDTANYIQQYGSLETMYNMYDLESAGIKHNPLRQILANINNTYLTLNAIDILIRHKDYMVALEALGALKDMGYKASETKKVQQRMGKLMSYEMNKQNYSYDDALDAISNYTDDKWYSVFAKDFKKSMKSWSRQSR